MSITMYQCVSSYNFVFLFGLDVKRTLYLTFLKVVRGIQILKPNKNQ